MKRLVLAVTASVFALTATPVLAQVAPDETAQSDDIIVTATRSETKLSKTPITMTAITGAELRAAGVTDARSLTTQVPGLSLNENSDAVRISIRGVTSSDTTEKGDPSAAFLINGIYIARAADVLGSFYDVDRIEVLRGPQGTLFGRNTTAGVINVLSHKATDRFEGSIDGSYSSRNTVDLTGMINVPLGQEIGLRGAVNYQRQDPYFKVAGTPTVPVNPARDAISGRLTLTGKLGTNFSFNIVGDYSNTRGTGVIGNAVTLDRFFPGALSPTIDPLYVSNIADFQRTLTVAPTFPNNRNNTNYGVSGEFSYDFGAVQLTYLGSFRHTDRRDNRDQFLFGAVNNPGTFFGTFEQNSHELRLAFGQGSPLHGQVGAYYFHEKVNLELNIGNPLSGIVAGGNGPPNFNVVGFAFPQGPVLATSKAAFAQLTYDITPDLHLTGGIRYTKDDKSRNGATVFDFNTVANSFCGTLRCVLNQNIASGHYQKTTWKAGIDYDAPGLGLLYATVSTGYKAGGFNDGCITGTGIGCNLTAAALFYDPETLTAYEAGAKIRISSAFRFTAAAFHYDYGNLQVQQIVTTPVPGTLIRNAASAKVDGFEIQSVVQPGPNDRFDIDYAYTNARYSNFSAQVTVANSTLSRNFGGAALDHAPKHVATFAYTHTFPLGDAGKFEVGGRIRLISDYYMIDLNNASQFRQPSFTKSDLTATYTSGEDRFYIQGFVRNIENKITLAAASSGLTAAATIEEPRTFGVRAGIKF